TAFPSSFTIASGLGGATSWPIGATWTINVTSLLLALPDNLTISILSNNVLIYRDVLPGSYPTVPPEFTNSGVTPTTPLVGSSFIVFVQIADQNLPTNSRNVKLNYSLLPGPFSGVAPQSMSWSPSSGSWQFSIPAGTTQSGSYFVYVTAIDTNGLSNTIAIAVNLELNPNGAGPVSVAIFLGGPNAINGTVSTILAMVTDNGAAGGTASVQFFLALTSLGTPAGAAITAGGTATVSITYTWTEVGAATIFAKASVPGVGSANSTLSFTVFPSILVIAKNTAYTTAKSFSSSDEAGWLEQGLLSAGIPFTAATESCSATLGSTLVSGSSTYTLSSFGIVVIDYGSSTYATTCKNDLHHDEAELEALATGTTSVWIIGSNPIFGCTAPVAAFQTDFGLKYSTSCGSAVALPATITYSPNYAVGLENDGIAGSYSVNATVAANATYVLYSMNNWLSAGSHATTFLTDGASDLGAFYAPSTHSREVFETVDPSTMAQTLPDLDKFDSGAGAASLVYNVIDYLGGITTSATPTNTSNHGGTDFGVGEVAVLGQGHASSKPTTVYAAVRSNGEEHGAVTVLLLVNGVPATLGGATVGTTIFLAGGGVSEWITLVWEAPAAGSYSLSVELLASGDNYALNNELGPGILNQPLTFS
ncbi:MAG: hypothetical protein ACREC5_00520, partial [Thermoplasmata archaeon]